MSSNPYVPEGIVLPGYVENTYSLEYILAVFFGSVTTILVPTYFIGRNLKTGDRLTLVWFVACFAIHFILEGYFSYFHADIWTHDSFLGQVWKEYAKSDSRYVTNDSFVVPMETFTAFVEGPLALLTAYAIIYDRPYRWVLQLIVSFGEFYGDILYYASAYWFGFHHSRPEALYFWFYFFFMNILWIIIPFVLICQSVVKIIQINSAYQGYKKAEDKKKVK